MADQFVIVDFQVPAQAVPYTVDITSPSITDTFSAAILIFSRTATDDSNASGGLLGIGFIAPLTGDQATQTLQCAASTSLEDVATAQDNETERSVTQCIRITDGSAPGVFDIVAEYSATIPGGVQINVTTADVAAKCTAILFAGLGNAAVGNCTFTDGGITHEDVGKSGSNFEPDLIITRSSDNSVTATTPNGTLALGFALNRPGIPQVSSYINWDDRADPTNSDGFMRSDCCSGAFIGDRGASMDRIQVTSFDSTGFNATAIDTGGVNSPQFNYLALQFVDPDITLACDNIAVSTSASQSFNLGIQPQLVFGMSTLMTSEDTIINGATAASAGHFAFSAAKSRAFSVSNQFNLNLNPTTSIARTRQGDHAVLTLTDTAAVAQQASLTGMTATGFDLNFSTATVGFLTVLGIGSGSLLSVINETERISETAQLVIGKFLNTTEVEQISESSVFVLNDGLSDRGPAGFVAESKPVRGAVFEGGPVAGVVLG